jgi:hypothetical protein
MVAGDGGERLLGPVKCPLTGEDTGVLVAVTVADHDLEADILDVLFQGLVPGTTGLLPPAHGIPGHGMLDKILHDGRGHLEVLFGFEERDHRHSTIESLFAEDGQSGFPGQQIHCQEVGKIAGHADNQASHAVGAVLVDVLRAQAVGIEDGFGFGARACRAMQERTGGFQFFEKEIDPLGFRPVGIVFAIEAGGVEQLHDRFFMEGTILADIEHGEVEAEYPQGPDEGVI